MAELKYEDFLKKSLSATQSLIDENENLKTSLKELAKVSEDNIKKLDMDSSTESYNKFNKELQKLEDTEKSLQKLIDNGVTLSEKEKSVNKELLIVKEKDRKEKKKLADAVKLELALSEKTIKSIESLTDRNKTLTKAANKLNLETKEGVEQYKKLTDEVVDNTKALRKIKEETKRAEKEQDTYNDALKVEKDLSSGLITTKNQLAEANKKLRLAVSNLNLDTQANDIQRLNQIIDKNTKLIDDNSDELIQAKNNVGKYESSVENLLQTQGLFSKELAIYNRIMQISSKLTKKNTKATSADAKSKITLANATRRAKIAMIKLNRSMKKNTILLIIGAIIALVSAFAKTADGADKAKLGMSNLSSAVDILMNRLGALATYIDTAWQRAIINIEIRIEKLKLRLLKLANVDLTGDTFKDYSSLSIGILSVLQEITKMTLKSKKEIEGIIGGLKLELVPLDKKSLDAWDRATGNIIDQIKEINKKNKEILQLQKDSAVEARQLELLLTKQKGLRENLATLRDAESLSLTERLALTDTITKKDEEITKNEITLAKTKLKIANENIRKKLLEVGVTEKITEEELNGINKNTKLRRLMGAEGKDLLDQQSEALIKLTDAENDGIARASENKKERLTLENDISELKLDNLTKFNEALTQQNMLIIGNDKLSLDRKIEAQKKIKEINDKTFDAQIKSIVKIQNANIKTEAELLKLTGRSAEEIKKKTESLLDESDIRDLMNAKDAVAFEEMIENLLLAERINAAVADLLKEQFNIKQDQIDVDSKLKDEAILQKELAGDIKITEQEKLDIKEKNAELKKLLEEKTTDYTIEQKERLRDKIQEIEDDITKTGKEADEKRRKNHKESLEAQLKLVDENSTEGLQIRKEIADLELEVEENKTDELSEIAGNRPEIVDDNDLKENLDATLDFIGEYMKLRSDAKLDAIDDQMSAVEKREQQLLAAIESGNGDATASLAKLRQEEEKLQAQKQKEQEKAASMALLISGLKAYNNNLDEGKTSPQALAATITGVIALTGFLSALPSFATGTDSFGGGTERIDKGYGSHIHNGTDGQLAYLNVGERVIPTELNNELGGISNKSLVDNFKEINSKPKNIVMQSSSIKSQSYAREQAKNRESNDNIVANKIDKLIKVMSNDSKFEFNSFENSIIKSTQINNKKINVTKKLKIR